MRLALCTCPPDAATKIAEGLVARGAACVNVVPGLTSIYRWKGELQRDSESLLVVKAAAERMPELFRALAELHPYELPEWVVVEPDALLTSAAYRSWVREG